MRQLRAEIRVLNMDMKVNRKTSALIQKENAIIFKKLKACEKDRLVMFKVNALTILVGKIVKAEEISAYSSFNSLNLQSHDS